MHLTAAVWTAAWQLQHENEMTCRKCLCMSAQAACCLQDYVKWRGPLFHRFLLALVDDSASVRALAEYLLTDTLASKVSSFAASP